MPGRAELRGTRPKEAVEVVEGCCVWFPSAARVGFVCSTWAGLFALRNVCLPNGDSGSGWCVTIGNDNIQRTKTGIGRLTTVFSSKTSPLPALMLPGIMAGRSCLLGSSSDTRPPQCGVDQELSHSGTIPMRVLVCLVTLHILDLAVSRGHGVSLGSTPVCWAYTGCTGLWNVQMYSAS